MNTNVLTYLEETVRRVPDKVAFTGEGESVCFASLSTQAKAIGTALLQDGWKKKPVVVFMKKRPKTVAAFLGAIYAGGFYVPLDPQMPPQRMKLIFGMLGEVACICDETTAATAEKLMSVGKIYDYAHLAQSAVDEEALHQVRAAQIDTDPVYIVFTSGSTGVPKGVVGCHRAVIDYIENLCTVLKFDETTIFGNQTPLYFDACLKEIMPTLKYGATTDFIPRRLFLFPVQLVEYLNQKRINTLCWVSSALTYVSAFQTFDQIRPQWLRTVAFASEVFPVRQLNLWRSALPDVRFINLYGPTETTGICCYYEVDREFDETQSLPIGRPFANTQILLLNEHNQEPEWGNPGEICIRGSRLTLGYYDAPEKTAQSFVRNPLNSHYPEYLYRTGDLGAYNAQGELMFLGRMDEQIKHMGHRIELGEIQSAALELESVHDACCIYETQKIFLYYVGSCMESAVHSWLAGKLPRYMMPHNICRMEQIPRMPNGKVNRRQLQERSKHYGEVD